MNEMEQLANLIKKRNMLENEITALIGRPAQIGHIGEYIAAEVFKIALEESAARKGIDGHFIDKPLAGRSVNIKWYAKREGMLDITQSPLDYFLVLAGPKSKTMNSRGQVRPWLIDSVFLFEANPLITQLKNRKVAIGIATSVEQQLWDNAEIYPEQKNLTYMLSDEQRKILALFREL